MTTHAPAFKKFTTRQDAGRALAKRLDRLITCPYRPYNVVIGLPKGGVAVGAEIARCLNLPFDILLVAKITVPGCGQTPLGAITGGGVRMLNAEMIDRLHLSEEEIHRAVLRQAVEIARRERTYRRERPSIDVADRTVILVDDGSSKCSTVRCAIRLLRRQHAEHVVVAMPTACHHTACDMRMEADEVVTLLEPAAETPVSRCYANFAPPSTEDIQRILRSAPMQDDIMN